MVELARCEQLIEKVENEHKAFQDNLLKLSSKEIIEKSYEITVKNELLWYIQNESDNETLEENEIAALFENKDILETMYQKYRSQDHNEFLNPIESVIEKEAAFYEQKYDLQHSFLDLKETETIQITSYIDPVGEFTYRQYEFTIDGDGIEYLEKKNGLEPFDLNTDIFRVQYEDNEPKIMEASRSDWHVYEDVTHLFSDGEVKRIVEYCEEQHEHDFLTDRTAEYNEEHLKWKRMKHMMNQIESTLTDDMLRQPELFTNVRFPNEENSSKSVVFKGGNYLGYVSVDRQTEEIHWNFNRKVDELNLNQPYDEFMSKASKWHEDYDKVKDYLEAQLEAQQNKDMQVQDSWVEVSSNDYIPLDQAVKRGITVKKQDKNFEMK